MLALVPSALGESSSNLDSISIGQVVTNVSNIIPASDVVEAGNGVIILRGGKSLSEHIVTILGSVKASVVSISDIGEVGLQWGQVSFSQAEVSSKEESAKVSSKFHGTIKAGRQDVVGKPFHGIGRNLALQTVYNSATNFDDVLPIGVINGVMNQIPNSIAVTAVLNGASGLISDPGGAFGGEPEDMPVGGQTPPGSINFPGVATPDDFPSESGFAGVPGHNVGGAFTSEPSDMPNADPPGFEHANENALTHSNAPDALAGNAPNGFQGEG